MPLLGRYLRAGAARELAQRAAGGSRESVRCLAYTLSTNDDPRVKAIAGDALRSLDRPTTVDAFCSSWFATRAEPLAAILVEKQYVAANPLKLKTATALKAGRIGILADLGEDVIEHLIAGCGDTDETIARRSRLTLGALRNRGAVEAFCKHLLSDPRAELVRIAARAGYAPRDEARRALFYFVTEQWEAYESLDFQEARPLLRRGYTEASEAARRSFLRVARRSGRSSVVSAALVNKGKRLRVQDMSPAEWETVVSGLKLERKWKELWRLCLLAPVPLAADIILSLRDRSWGPQEHDRELWEELVRLCPPEGKETVLVPGGTVTTITHLKGEPSALAVTPDGGILAGGVDDTVRLWRIPSGSLLSVLEGHSDHVRSLAISRDGLHLASAGKDRTVRFWNIPRHVVSPPRAPREGHRLAIMTLEGHRGEVSSLALSPDGAHLFSASRDGTVRGWSFPEGTEQAPLAHKSLRRETSWVLCLAITPDGEVIATGSKDSSVRLWHAASGNLLKTLQAHQGGALCLSVTPDGKTLASGGKEGSVVLWDLPHGTRRATLRAHEGGVTCLAVTPDGGTLASGGHDGKILLWRLAEARPRETLKGHTGSILNLTVCRGGSILVSASSDATVGVWNVRGGERITTLTGHAGQVRSLAVTPDGRFLATGSEDKTIRLWHLFWTKPLALADHRDLARAAAMSSERDMPPRHRRAWLFLEALLRAKFRYDITLEESVISVDAYDIEIEIDG